MEKWFVWLRASDSVWVQLKDPTTWDQNSSGCGQFGGCQSELNPQMILVDDVSRTILVVPVPVPLPAAAHL